MLTEGNLPEVAQGIVHVCIVGVLWSPAGLCDTQRTYFESDRLIAGFSSTLNTPAYPYSWVVEITSFTLINQELRNARLPKMAEIQIQQRQ